MIRPLRRLRRHLVSLRLSHARGKTTHRVVFLHPRAVSLPVVRGLFSCRPRAEIYRIVVDYGTSKERSGAEDNQAFSHWRSLYCIPHSLRRALPSDIHNFAFIIYHHILPKLTLFFGREGVLVRFSRHFSQISCHLIGDFLEGSYTYKGVEIC